MNKLTSFKNCAKLIQLLQRQATIMKMSTINKNFLSKTVLFEMGCGLMYGAVPLKPVTSQHFLICQVDATVLKVRDGGAEAEGAEDIEHHLYAHSQTTDELLGSEEITKKMLEKHPTSLKNKWHSYKMPVNFQKKVIPANSKKSCCKGDYIHKVKGNTGRAELRAYFLPILRLNDEQNNRKRNMDTVKRNNICFITQ
ncbi:hypothetical protein Y1Q_0007412 [Alligator mississippiensis]|uniref:Uncharacterized protein n=1 Tax=Alligator mississippiensis TaxID=8496 RepID=A0A151P7V9_ALLMI|nr:hypothetical protein Y1Q_0007412 [Alligator mississippiensis]